MKPELEAFTPEEVYPASQQGQFSYWTFLVETRPCACCGTAAIERPPRGERGHFPVYFKINFEAQAKRAGIRAVSHYDDNGKPVCVTCAQEGRGKEFVCALCKERRSTTEIEKSFGSPSEHLCKPCYASVPAKTWNDPGLPT